MSTRLMKKLVSDRHFSKVFAQAIDAAKEDEVSVVKDGDDTYNIAKINDNEFVAEDESTNELTSLETNPKDESDMLVSDVTPDAFGDETEVETSEPVEMTKKLKEGEDTETTPIKEVAKDLEKEDLQLQEESYSEGSGKGIMIKIFPQKGQAPIIKLTDKREEFDNYSALFTRSAWVSNYEEGVNFLKKNGIEDYLSEKDFSETLKDVSVSKDEGIEDEKKADGKKVEDTIPTAEVKPEEGITDKDKAGLKNFSVGIFGVEQSLKDKLYAVIKKAFDENKEFEIKETSDGMTPMVVTPVETEPEVKEDAEVKDEVEEVEKDLKEDHEDIIKLIKDTAEDLKDKIEKIADPKVAEELKEMSDELIERCEVIQSEPKVESETEFSEMEDEELEVEDDVDTETYSDDNLWDIVDTKTGKAVKTGKREDLEKLLKKPEYNKKISNEPNAPFQYQLIHNSREKFSSTSIKKLLAPLGEVVEEEDELVDVTPQVDPNTVEDKKVFSKLSDSKSANPYLFSEFN